MNPIAHVAMSKHYRPGVREQSIGGHVVEVIVGVDYEFHRKLGDLPNRGKELLTVVLGVKLPSASTVAVVSMTTTPSSPMTNPVLAARLEIATQTFRPACFSVKSGSVTS